MVEVIHKLDTLQKIKFNKLKEYIKSLGKVVLAYSGGVDSTLLLKVCKDVLDNKCVAVVADSIFYPKDEIKFAIKTAKEIGINPLVVKLEPLSDKKIITNPPDRCYLCKKILFRRLCVIAREKNIEFIIDGSNYDDRGDYRPGFRAIKECGVKSPLLELCITKKDVRLFSKELGLCTWNNFSSSCLATRFIYGVELDENLIDGVAKAEKYIKSFGVRQVRVRHFDKVARIEVEPREMAKIIRYRNRIGKYLKFLGYVFVDLDMEGYRTGNMNKLIESEQRHD